MAIGKEEQIFSFSVHIEFWIMLHELEIQGHKEVCASERASRVARLAGMHHTYNVSADL